MSFTSKFSGVLLGAGLMYFLDPARGRKRRARVIDAATHARRVEHELVGKAVRDAQHRAQGLAERVRHPHLAEVSDAVVEGRVRAHLGRVTSHPRALQIDVRDGRVIVRGPIYAREADRVVRALRAIAGVREVEDRLDRHDTAESVPALQGEGRIRRGRGATWPPAVQVAAIGTGLALSGYGLVRRGLTGMVVGAAGGALVARGLMNRPLRFGEGVSVHKTVTVRAPIDQVFDLWTRFEEFPHFMEHVREVQVNGDRSRWKVDGAPGTTVSFEVETTRLEPNRLLAWRTLPDQAIRHEGVIKFEEADGATRVHVQMSYHPPAGMVGHAIARILGWDPKKRMDEDFIRMKALLENGRTRAHHHRIDLSKLH